MAGPGIVAASTGRLLISDTWLEEMREDTAAVIDLQKMTPTAAFLNRSTRARGNLGNFHASGISIDGARTDAGGADYTAASGVINGCLRDEPQPQPQEESYNCRQVYPERFMYIYANQTTARGIHVHSAG
jgi:hypothetical protein